MVINTFHTSLSRIKYLPLVYTQSFHRLSLQSSISFLSQASQAPLIASRFSDVTVTCHSWTDSLHGLCGVMARKLPCYVGQYGRVKDDSVDNASVVSWRLSNRLNGVLRTLVITVWTLCSMWYGLFTPLYRAVTCWVTLLWYPPRCLASPLMQ